jgi:hypothetical protein
MRRRIVMVVSVVWLGLIAGCIGIAGNEINPGRSSDNRQTIAVDGRVYVVDMRSGKVHKVDLSAAEPFPAKPCAPPASEKPTGANEAQSPDAS